MKFVRSYAAKCRYGTERITNGGTVPEYVSSKCEEVF